MKFPYGLCDFYRLITEGYWYADRTNYIPIIEEMGDQLLFLRPRRFGKSLLLSMLENYYDVARAAAFEKVFGHLAIGRNPTPRHNQYFVMKWDFSMVSSIGAPEQIQQALYDHINVCIDSFQKDYQQWLAAEIPINPANAIASLQALAAAVRRTPYRIYLLIDEYDNFANEVMLGTQPFELERYKALLYGEGALKTLFKAIKALSAGGGVEKVFITGVSPIVLSDITSGYNIAENIYFQSRLNDLCGFEESEIMAVLQTVINECRVPAEKATEALAMMRTFYNGYCFSPSADTLVYNPTLALYFLKSFQQECRYPRQMLDSNLAMDRSKLHYIAQLPHGKEVLVNALNETAPLSIPQLADRFGVEDMLSAPKDNPFMVSLLYYFGVLTIGGVTTVGKLRLNIPNLVVKELYFERLQRLLLPDLNHDEAAQAAETLFTTGNLQPVCDFIEQRYFTVFDNRDYRWANELTIKTIFLTLLFNDLWYMMDSEPALQRDYADGSTSLTTGLVMLLRPDMRQYALLDLLLEFKYISLKELNLSGEAVRQLSPSERCALPLVQQHLRDARAKLTSYRQTLHATYGERLRLHTYAVIAVGFDRVVWEEVEPAIMGENL